MNKPPYSLMASLLRPPYRGLPWLVFAYALLSGLIYTYNGPFTGHVVGFDDQARMVQILQWVNGGGWYDRLITRVNAPDGFHTIWARIVDIPYALVILAAQLATDQKSAALCATVLVPLAELALMFAAVRYAARPIAGKREARLVLLFLMFTTVLNHKNFTLAGFHMGEASHHAWYGILNVVMLGAAVRVVLGIRGRIPQAMLGLAMGLLLAVGIEGFPMIAGTVVILSFLAWAFDHVRLAERGAAGVGVGAALSFLLLPMQVPPDNWLDISFSQPSLLGPILLAVAAVFLLLQSLMMRRIRTKALSALTLAVVALIFAYLLTLAFPQILGGSLAGLSPSERAMALNEHPEVWPMFRVATDTVDYIGLLMPSLIAVAAGIVALGTAGNRRRRMMFGAYLGLTLLSSGLAQVYWRFVHHAQTALCPLLLWAWQKIRARLPDNRFHALAALLVFLLLGPFWMVLLPAMDQDAPFLSQVVFFPAKIYSVPLPCDPLPLTDYLDGHYDDNVKIVVPEWESATFLFQTHLKIDFLSNYPSQDKFIDNHNFFWTQDPEQAKDIAARHKFDLVAVCNFIPMNPAMAATRPYRAPAFIERLKEGSAPDWLKPVDTGVESNYRLYSVDHAQLGEK